MTDRQNTDDQDIAYLIVGVVALLGVTQLWRLRVKPWLVDHGILSANPGKGDLFLGLQTSDVVGIALIVVPAIVAVVLLRSWIRRKAARGATESH